MQLQLSTWLEVEAYLERSKAILIPIGSTEQHGPNGLIGTDAICPETLARGVGDKIGALVGPTLNLGMAQHHLAFPGTIALRPSTLLAVLQDTLHSLIHHGFRQFYFLNGHGGNIATVTAAFSEIYTTYSLASSSDLPTPTFRLGNWWTGNKIQALSQELFATAEGWHATPSEVSLSWYAYPDAVKNTSMSPRLAPKGEIRDAKDFRRQFPDGRIGSDPSLASVAAGEKIYHAGVADVIEDYQSFIIKSPL